MATETSTKIPVQATSFRLEQSSSTEPADVEVDIHYYKDPGDGTVAGREELASNYPKFCDTRRTIIRDVRGQEHNFRLDVNGFEYFHHPVPIPSALEDDKIKEAYYSEMEDVIKMMTGAKTARAYNHIIRDDPWIIDKKPSHKVPSVRPHIDIARSWAPEALKRVYKDEAEDITSKHWQLLNLWRPLKPVQRNPLAMIDSLTVPLSDQAVVQLDQNKDGEKFYTDVLFIKADHAEQHRWYYMSEQKPDEVLMFKIYDSDDDAKAPGAPHGSFNDPKTEHLSTRESIEMRFIVSY